MKPYEALFIVGALTLLCVSGIKSKRTKGSYEFFLAVSYLILFYYAIFDTTEYCGMTHSVKTETPIWTGLRAFSLYIIPQYSVIGITDSPEALVLPEALVVQFALDTYYIHQSK